MIYCEYAPVPELTRYVDKFWYCFAADSTSTVLTIPLLHHELVIDVSGCFEISGEVPEKSLIGHTKAWISGIQSRPTRSKSKGKHEMLGVLFSAAGLRAFNQYSLAELSDEHIDASLIFGGSFEGLLDEIQSAGSAFAKIQILQHYLLRKLHDPRYPRYLHASMQLLSQQGDQKPLIKEVAKSLGITNKSLITAFNHFVGISPAKYVQLHRVNKAIDSLSKNPKQSLTKLAYHLNFFDQSHFIHSFESFTGLSPSHYCAAVTNKQIEIGAPNFIQVEG
jgi:AraC-like DNA-binding protein